jgi:hypothetical protein
MSEAPGALFKASLVMAASTDHLGMYAPSLVHTSLTIDIDQLLAKLLWNMFLNTVLTKDLFSATKFPSVYTISSAKFCMQSSGSPALH